MKAGDHIRITKGSVSEHAIEVGDRTVIHFVPGEGVKRSRLDRLASDGARVEVVVHRHSVYVPKHVVARAFSRFSDSAYSAMFRDSEEFASWCKTGKMPARPLVSAPEPSSERAPRAAKPSKAGRASAARASPRAAAKKSRTRKAAKPAAATRSKPAVAARSKSARTAKPSAPAKRGAPAKLARGGRKIGKPSVAAKPGRTTRPAGNLMKSAGRKGLSSPTAKLAKPQKGAARAPAANAKQKRGKPQGRRAATGR